MYCTWILVAALFCSGSCKLLRDLRLFDDFDRRPEEGVATRSILPSVSAFSNLIFSSLTLSGVISSLFRNLLKEQLCACGDSLERQATVNFVEEVDNSKY